MSILISNMKMPEEGYVDVRFFADGKTELPTTEKPYYEAYHASEITDCKDCEYYEAHFVYALCKRLFGENGESIAVFPYDGCKFGKRRNDE